MEATPPNTSIMQRIVTIRFADDVEIYKDFVFTETLMIRYNLRVHENSALLRLPGAPALSCRSMRKRRYAPISSLE
jgi:hypothetical protein